MKRGAASYCGVDPFVAGFLRKDALSHMLEQDDNSAVVLSYYVQAQEMFITPSLLFLPEPVRMRTYVCVERYNDCLAKEIARVIIPGGFVYHSFAYDPEEWDHRYTEAGLVKEKTGLFLKK